MIAPCVSNGIPSLKQSPKGMKVLKINEIVFLPMTTGWATSLYILESS
jgi:hypothetical protein